jgi:hypothetical protein
MSNETGGFLIITLGLFPIIAVWRKWGWFRNYYIQKAIYKLLGNTWGTVFNIGYGMIFIIIGVLVMLGVFDGYLN